MNFLGVKSLVCLLFSTICFLLSTFSHASLPPSQNSIAHVQAGSKNRARGSAILSRAAEDKTAPSSFSFLNEKRDNEASSELNIFDGSQPPQAEPAISPSDQPLPVENQGNLNYISQLPQVEPNISPNDQPLPVENQGNPNYISQLPQVEPNISPNDQPLPVENQGNPNDISQPSQVVPGISSNDQPFPVENQGNPIQHDDAQNLALLGDGENVIPSLPWLGGSGDMNYGGPNPIEMLEQFVDKVRGSFFDPKKPTKPECAKRAIPYGRDPNELLDMFPFCCEKAFKYLGGPRRGFTGDPEQRRLSILGRRVGCAAWSPSKKCNIHTTECCYCKRESRNVAFECRKYYDKDGKPGADADPNPASNTPKREVIPITKMLRYNASAGARSGRLSPRDPKAPYTCTADFLVYEGLTPQVRKKKLPAWAEPEPEEPPEYEEYCEDDENCDEDDFEVPEGWNSDPRHISPNQW